MKRFAIVAIIALLTALSAGTAQAHGFVSVGVSVGCCGYYPYPAYYGYPAYYYAPPATVVYAAPPTVVYAQPPSLLANQTSPTFVDSAGRACRQFQTSAGGVPVNGTACLQPDGIWRSVGG